MISGYQQNRMANPELFYFLKNTILKVFGLKLEEDNHFLVLKDKDKVIARWSATGVTAEEIRDTTNSYILNNYSYLELRLLHFWGHHPRTKLSLYTIANAMDTARINLRHAIAALVAKGILDEQQDGNGLTTYSLNSDQQIQQYIEELTTLDWNRASVSTKQLEKEAVLV